jgi:DNA-binding FrmR family transcriptional regulator
VEQLRDRVLERMKEIRSQVNGLQKELEERPELSAVISDVRITLDGLLNQVNHLENRIHSMVLEHNTYEDTKKKD